MLDLGANRGEFSRMISENWECRIDALEPVPELFRALPSLAGVTSYQVAASDHDGPVTLFLSYRADGHSANRRVAKACEGSDANTVLVPGVALATLFGRCGLNRVDLMKVDIEGAEIDAFDAAPDSILAQADQITVEFHDFADPSYAPGIAATKRRLRSLGFVCLQFSPLHHEDVLFCHQRALARLTWRQRACLLLLERLLLPTRRRWAKWLAAKQCRVDGCG